MKNSAISRWRVGAWIVLLGLSAMMLQACGDDEGCGDFQAVLSENECARYALTNDCGSASFSFDSDTRVCSASSCRICPTNTPVRFPGTPSPGPTNTPVPLPPNFSCDVAQVLNTPRPTITTGPGGTPSPTPLPDACRALALLRVCGSPNYSFEPQTGLCQVEGCGLCNFSDDVF